VEQAILGKLKDLTKKFKKDSEDVDLLLDEDESTGEVDIDLLDEDGTDVDLLDTNKTIGTELRSEFENDLEDESIDLEEELVDEDYDEEDLEGSDSDREERNPVLKFMKSQLPFLYKLIPKKKSSKSSEKIIDEDFEDDDFEEESGNKNFIEKQLPFLAKFIKPKTKSHKDDEGDDEDEEAPKKKRKLNLIQVIIIVAILFLAMDFLFPEEEPAPAPVLKKIQKTKRPKVVAPKEEADIADINSDIEPVSPRDIIEDKVQPIGEESDTAEPIVEDPIEDPIIESEGENLKDLFKEEDAPIVDEVPEPIDTVQEIPSEESDDEDDINPEDLEDSDLAPIPQPSDGDLFNDGVVDEVIDSSNTPNITDSILRSLEGKIKENKKVQVLKRAVKPTSAPEYDVVGRGLIYNCSGKHWACIDSVSFNKCSENFSWNTQSGNSIECYPTELYESVEDCAVIQQFKIDNIARTDFCN
jgi:hypothetical protein